VVIDMSISLDGYITAPNDNPEQGLGEDGMRLHNWAFDYPSVFERVYGNLVEETGAVIMGRRSYDNSIQAWMSSSMEMLGCQQESVSDELE
jgi:dihydrofolate reductase